MMQDLDELQAWCALWRLPRVGPKRFQKLQEVFGSPKTFFSSVKTSRLWPDLRLNAADLDLAQKLAEMDIHWLQTGNANHIITLASKAYPKQLATIADAPPVLFVKGEVSLLAEPQLAIIGSRSPSYDGLENARRFADHFTQQGLLVTSGLALGIDGEAHRGALITGKTLAVMGTGIDRIYPSRHRDLAYQIVENGALISEFPLATPVKSESFPRRNRLISGLSLGVLVVEASIKSGSLITAKIAAEQGREVFAIPGSIHNPHAKGCNLLIKQGAKLIEVAADVFYELQAQLQAYLAESNSEIDENKSTLEPMTESTQLVTSGALQMPKKNSGQQSVPSTRETSQEASQNATQQKRVKTAQTLLTEHPALNTATEQTIWAQLTDQPAAIDELAKRCQLPVNEISAALLMMELNGLVLQSLGGKYAKKYQ